ncbi:hypothetical protein GCM10010284_66000 [Streptomyces rubiginosohelvolus]|nr:hypothetical protein GCM10010284_66000 [Streptomyces rubiginosohelvolus]
MCFPSSEGPHPAPLPGSGTHATALTALIPEVVQLDRDAARKRAERFCSVEAMADQYTQLYEELIT